MLSAPQGQTQERNPLMRVTRNLLAIMIALALADTVRAADEVQLFNGKDFTGWTYVSRDTNSKLEDAWSVKDGAMICKGQPIGYIRTDKDYTSYVLKLQWRFSKPGNS